MDCTRRAVLAGATGLAASVAGCSAAEASADPVSVLSAGSLQVAFTEGLPERTDHSIRVESYGSRRAARLVAEGQRDPDVLALADPALFDSVLSTPWYTTFASNAVALAYDPDSAGGQRVADADRWYDPLLTDEVTLGRTDPDLDPLGYRTLLTLALAGDYYGVDRLRERVVGPEQVYPETQLLAGFETGGVDAAFVYRNMAVERDYPYLDLPAEIDLSDPELSDRYATASVALDDGTTVTGEPIAYGATCRHDREAATAVFETVVEDAPTYLEATGFAVRDTFPIYHGDVPKRFR
ncbi:MAG: extracellular solute-binding protein [Haloarculaceae archaeon]